MKISTVCFLGCICLVAANPVAAFEADTPEARAKLVDEYFTYMPMSKMMDEMVQEVSKQIPEPRRAQFIDTLTKNMRFEVIEAAARESIAKHLTVTELEVFVAFIKKPEARSAMDKMKYYMADLLPVIQEELIRASRQAAQDSKQQ